MTDLLAPVVVAVDGGGSKTDAVALTLDGRVVARARGGGSSPDFLGVAASVAVVGALVEEVAGSAPMLGVDLYLSGLDLPAETTAYLGALRDCPWAADVVVDNDLFALLRTGTDAPDSVAVVCGTGINAVGLRRDGARVRFPALGAISGDWGGGYGLGVEALWHAARDVDGRGPATALTDAVCRVLAVASVGELVEQLHLGGRAHTDLAQLAPSVFAAAEAGDVVAGGLVDRQADEVVALVRAAVQRLDLAGEPVPVVLGGAILQAGHARLDERVTAGVLACAPRAELLRPKGPPLAGVALLALARAGAAEPALTAAALSIAGTSRVAHPHVAAAPVGR